MKQELFPSILSDPLKWLVTLPLRLAISVVMLPLLLILIALVVVLLPFALLFAKWTHK